MFLNITVKKKFRHFSGFCPFGVYDAIEMSRENCLGLFWLIWIEDRDLYFGPKNSIIGPLLKKIYPPPLGKIMLQKKRQARQGLM